MTFAADRVRHAMRTSANRHWFGRLVIATWVLVIALFAFLEPDSIVAHAMELAGSMGFLMMTVLTALALGALADAAIHDLVPGKLQQLLMIHRHGSTMGMAIVLVVEGGGLAVRSHLPYLLLPFLLLAAACVAVTFLDLFSTSRERSK